MQNTKNPIQISKYGDPTSVLTNAKVILLLKFKLCFFTVSQHNNHFAICYICRSLIHVYAQSVCLYVILNVKLMVWRGGWERLAP